MPTGTSPYRRGDRIRTCDHLVPNQVRYRTALRPEDLDGSLRQSDAKVRIISNIHKFFRQFNPQFLPIPTQFNQLKTQGSYHQHEATVHYIRHQQT